MTTTTVKERPILFSPLLAGKVHDGSKTQTRRVVKFRGLRAGVRAFRRETIDAAHSPDDMAMMANYIMNAYPCPYGVPGDRLWVKERHQAYTCCHTDCGDEWETWRRDELDPDRQPDSIVYAANPRDSKPDRWRASIHMPRAWSRTVLDLIDVGIERVESITEEDAIAEGFCLTRCGANCDYEVDMTARENFLHTFYTLNKRAPLGSNPWVWKLTFKKVEASR